MNEKDAARLRRELLALVRRLADGPVTLEAGLRTTAALRRGLETLQTELVTTARDEGASWAAIGEALGVTTQAAHQRFSSKT